MPFIPHLAVAMAVATVAAAAYPPPHHIEVAVVGTVCILMLVCINLIVDRLDRRDTLVILGSMAAMWISLFAIGAV